MGTSGNPSPSSMPNTPQPAQPKQPARITPAINTSNLPPPARRGSQNSQSNSHSHSHSVSFSQTHSRPQTPSLSSPVAAVSPVVPTVPTVGGVAKRPLAPATDGAGRTFAPDRKPQRSADGRAQSVIDPATGKKKRISLSCAQCAKRKQKCNREYPCQHCLARKVPELCVPYTPTPSNSSNQGLDPGTQERIERIENVLSVVVRHNPGIGGYESVREWLASSTFQRFLASTPSTPVSPTALIPSQLHHPPLLPPKRQRTLDGQPIPPEDIEQMERGMDEEGRVGKTWLGDLEGGVPEGVGIASGFLNSLIHCSPTKMKTDENVTLRVDVHGTPAENLQRLITDCGVSPHKVQELIQELPPKPFADRVIDWYFKHLNLVRYPIDERLFRISYEDLYNKTTAVDPNNVRALPLVFIVLAMAVRLAPDSWAGDDNTRKISSLRMYWSSRRSILIATAIQSESIELVITRLLSAMYLVQIHDRRLTECWSQLGASLRTAQAIGLHRDGLKMGLDPFQTEYRRRCWSYLYHADRLYSLILGRPPSISDAYTDALSPSNVELSEYDLQNPASQPPQPRPLSEPTTATFLILRRRLSGIIGRIVHHFQKLNEPAQYADVQRLQDELDSFTATLPPHFRMRDADKKHYWLPVHRFMLLTEILVTTIILHRPWLLRRLSSNRYQASRTACFESAKLDFQIRQDFQREVPNYGLYSITGQFKMFNSAMIAGISAIIDPRGNDADQMRRILTTFLEQHPWTEVASLDETTRKEVQIIHTLSRRAAQIYEDTMAPGELNVQDKDSVSLLLALRQEGNYGSPHDTATPAPRSAPAPRTSWAKYMNTHHPNTPHATPGHGIMQSPASSGGHEDDHSQRLLDHWLSANSTMAVGGGPASMPIDPALAYVGGGGGGGGTGSTPSIGMTLLTPATFPPTPGFMQTPMPLGFMWSGDDTLAPSAAAAGAAGPPVDAFAPPPTSLDGTVLGAEGEGSDEYWNTLIDGILGASGGGA